MNLIGQIDQLRIAAVNENNRHCDEKLQTYRLLSIFANAIIGLDRGGGYCEFDCGGYCQSHTPECVITKAYDFVNGK